MIRPPMIDGAGIDYWKAQAAKQPTSNAGSVASAAAQAVAQPSGSGAASVAGGTAALPFEGVYQEQQALANKAYQEALNSINAKRSGIFRQYGFNPEGKVDPHNPIGLYQQMRRSQAAQLMGAGEERIARGLSARGLGAQQEADLRYDHEVQSSEMMRNYLSSLSDTDIAKQQAAQQLQWQLLQARQAQIAAGLQNEMFMEAPTDDAQNAVAPQAVAAAAPAPAPAPARQGVEWGGQTFTTKQALAKWLAARGANYNTWAQRHPGAAARLR